MQICCGVLCDLSEEIHEFNDRIQSARRQELRHAMALTLPQTLVYITKVVQHALDGSLTDLLQTAMTCLCSFIKWADLRSLFNASVPTACITLLSHESMRYAALDALDTLVTRQFPTGKPGADEHEGSQDGINANSPKFTFRNVLFPGLLQFITTTPSVLSFAPFSLVPPSNTFPPLKTAFAQPPNLNAISSHHFNFILRFFNMLAQLGASHFVSSFIIEKKTTRIKLEDTDAMCAAAYVDVLAIAVSVPSTELRFAVLPFFTSTLTAIGKFPDFASLASDHLVSFLANAYLQASSAAIIKIPDDPVLAYFAELIEIEEWQIAPRHGVFARLVSTFVLSARIIPAHATALSLHRLLRLLAATPEASPTPTSSTPNGNGLLPGATHQGIIVHDGSQHGWTFGPFNETQTEIWRACVAAACVFVDGVASGVVKCDDESAKEGMAVLMRQVFDTVLPMMSVAVQPVKAHVLRVLHPLYVRDEQARVSCVETLLAMAMSSGDGKRGSLRSKLVASLSAVLRRLCNSGVGEIGNFSQPLCEYAVKALGSRGFRSIEKINLMEAALASVMALSDLNEQSAGVERVLNPLLTFLSSQQVTNAIESSENLLSFLENGASDAVNDVCEAFLLTEAGVHQIVRPASKANARIPLPGILSRSIAPKAVEIGCMLITSLHNMCNINNEKKDRMEAFISMMQPTSREVSYLLNLDVVENIPKGVGELVESSAPELENGTKPSLGEQRSAEALQANGVTPASEKYARLRERLRDLRRGGNEMIRAAIYSGATHSPSHLLVIANTVCGNCERVEPYHLLSIMSRVLTPMLSYGVCSVDSNFLNGLKETGMGRLVRLIREHIVGGQRGLEIFSETTLMDLARENGRQMLSRCATDMLASMYPRVEHGEDKLERRVETLFLPGVFRVEGLGMEVLRLWQTICDAGNGKLDLGPARSSLNLIHNVVEIAGDGDFEVYGSLLTSCVRTAVVCSTSSEDPAGSAAIAAVMGIMKRWPAESEKALVLSVGQGREEVVKAIGECIEAICSTQDGQTSKVKRHKTIMKSLIERIAQVEGFAKQVQSTVHALPEKLNTKPHKKKVKNREDVELSDVALDSLFGEGDPL